MKQRKPSNGLSLSIKVCLSSSEKDMFFKWNPFWGHFRPIFCLFTLFLTISCSQMASLAIDMKNIQDFEIGNMFKLVFGLSSQEKIFFSEFVRETCPITFTFSYRPSKSKKWVFQGSNKARWTTEA